MAAAREILGNHQDLLPAKPSPRACRSQPRSGRPALPPERTRAGHRQRRAPSRSRRRQQPEPGHGRPARPAPAPSNRSAVAPRRQPPNRYLPRIRRPSPRRRHSHWEGPSPWRHRCRRHRARPAALTPLTGSTSSGSGRSTHAPSDPNNAGPVAVDDREHRTITAPAAGGDPAGRQSGRCGSCLTAPAASPALRIAAPASSVWTVAPEYRPAASPPRSPPSPRESAGGIAARPHRPPN